MQEAGRDEDTDDVSAVRVFAASTIAAGLADHAAWYLMWTGGDPGAVVLVGVVGAAFGARSAGGDLVAALTGSFLGLGLGVATALAVGDSGMPHGLVWTLVALAHGGVTALFAASDWF